MVLATGSQLIDDIRRAPSDVLSFSEPMKEVRWCLCRLQNGELILISIIQLLQSEYTLDLLNELDEYHTDIIRSQLTRNIADTFNDVREELIMGMDDLIPTREDSAWLCPGRRGYISHPMQNGSRSPF
jgi:hypothetical protein